MLGLEGYTSQTEQSTQSLSKPLPGNFLLNTRQISKDNYLNQKHKEYKLSTKINTQNNLLGLQDEINTSYSAETILNDPLNIVPNIKYNYFSVDDYFKTVSIDKIKDFNSKYSSTCPGFTKNPKESEKRMREILFITKTIELEKGGKKNIEEKFYSLFKREKKDISENVKQKIDTFSSTLFDDSKKELKKDSCAFDLRKLNDQKIKSFLESEGILNKNIDLGEISSFVSESMLESESFKKSQMQDNPELYTEEEINTQNQKVQIYQRIHYMTQNITSAQVEEYQELLDSGVSREEAINKIIEESEVLSSYFENQQKSSPSTPENDTTQNIGYTYNETSGTMFIPGETAPIKLSTDEQETVEGNPGALKNLVNFYKFFKELNLLGVWEHRKNLMLAIGDININPNDGDSIKNSELVKFGNKLLTFIANIENEGEQKQIKLKSLNSISLRLMEFSEISSGLSDSKTFNIEGEDKFTAYLRKAGIIGGYYFNISKFRENI